MLKMMAKSVLLIVFLGLVHFTASAPVKEAEQETPIDLVNNDADQQTDTGSIAEVSPTPEVLTKQDEIDNVNKEVTNYQTIETDDHIKEEPVFETVEDKNTGLTEEEAQELLLELSDPEEVAQFIVASDDAQGFLQALRMLTDQNYISMKLAYYLRDRVMEQLRRMLMIQEMELSRTLLNNYEPADFTPDQLPNDVPPAPYYDFNTFAAPNDMYSEEEEVLPFDIYEQALKEENSRALAEIAEAVAQKIAEGDLTPESGVKIMNTVAGLLPDSYWEDALNLYEEGEDNLYPLAYDEPISDYSSVSDSLEGDVIDLTGNSDETSAESEDNTEDILEDELKSKNRVLENALEKQLAEKAHMKETESDGTEETNLQKEESSEEYDLTDEDYQALFDWLENELQNASNPQEQKPEALLVKTDDEEKEMQQQPQDNSS